MQLRPSDFISAMGWRSPTGCQSGSLCSRSSSLTSIWTYYLALTKELEPFNDADLANHILRMLPKHWQDQYELTGCTVSQSVCKLLEDLAYTKKDFPTKKEHKGPKLVWLEVALPRKVWSLSAAKSQRNPTSKQSTVPYESSMGVCTTPVILASAVSMRRTVLRKGPLQERAHSATYTTEMHRVRIIIAMCRYLQRL